jgi:formylglycine-generating enzyme required for sulfatase activity
MESSGQIESAGGMGKTTSEMQTTSTFLDAGWDFVDETANGPNDVWKMWDGYDHPRLAWEAGPNRPLLFVDINDPGFYGQMSRYEVTNGQYCGFLNAALASGDIAVNGSRVEGAGGSNSGEDYAGQLYYNGDGSGYTGYGATNGGAARIHYDAGVFGVDDGFGNHPVTYVSWYGAMAFYDYYGYYLPAEDQWQAVADYDGTHIYGCGQTIDPGIANYRVSGHPDGTMPVGSLARISHRLN